MVDMLLERGDVDVNKSLVGHELTGTPLICAITRCNLQLVRRLLKLDRIDANKTEAYDEIAPLHMAVMYATRAHRPNCLNALKHTDGALAHHPGGVDGVCTLGAVSSRGGSK